MNPENLIQLTGSVQGDTWTRWKPGPGMRGQVRFRLAVSRELAGEGYDLFVCAIEPRSAAELPALERELRAGRQVKLSATARAVAAAPGHEEPCVIFVAEECGFDGQEARNVHALHRRPQVRGKLAAAGDVAELLPLEGGLR